MFTASPTGTAQSTSPIQQAFKGLGSIAYSSPNVDTLLLIRRTNIASLQHLLPRRSSCKREAARPDWCIMDRQPGKPPSAGKYVTALSLFCYQIVLIMNSAPAVQARTIISLFLRKKELNGTITIRPIATNGPKSASPSRLIITFMVTIGVRPKDPATLVMLPGYIVLAKS